MDTMSKHLAPMSHSHTISPSKVLGQVWLSFIAPKESKANKEILWNVSRVQLDVFIGCCSKCSPNSCTGDWVAAIVASKIGNAPVELVAPPMLKASNLKANSHELFVTNQCHGDVLCRFVLFEQKARHDNL